MPIGNLEVRSVAGVWNRKVSYCGWGIDEGSADELYFGLCPENKHKTVNAT